MPRRIISAAASDAQSIPMPLSDPLAAAVLHKDQHLQSKYEAAAGGEATAAETVSLTAPTSVEMYSQIDLCSAAEGASQLDEDSASDDSEESSCDDKEEHDEVDFDNFKLSQRTISFPLSPADSSSRILQVVVRQDLIGVEGTGGVVWPVCEHFCRLLISQEQNVGQSQEALCGTQENRPWYDVRGRRVLELGCGPGLASFVCAALGADVIGTDGDMDAIRLAKQAIKVNKDLLPAANLQQECANVVQSGNDELHTGGSLVAGRVRFQQFWWGRDDVAALGDKDCAYVPDVVVACDVMYDPAGVEDFSTTMRHIFQLNPHAVLVMALQRRRPELEDAALRQWVNEYDIQVIWHQGKYSAITVQRKQ